MSTDKGTFGPSATPCNWEFRLPPKAAGHYKVGSTLGIQYPISPKPSWLHRTMMRICLGWAWEEEE